MDCKICKNPLLKQDYGLYVKNKEDERYGICNACWERMKSEKEGQKAISDNLSKTVFIKVINIFQLFGFIIMAIMSWSDEETLQGFIYLIAGLVVFAFIKGFTDIIDLLDSINENVNK